MVTWECEPDAEGRQRGTSAFWDGLEARAVERRATRSDSIQP